MVHISKPVFSNLWAIAHQSLDCETFEKDFFEVYILYYELHNVFTWSSVSVYCFLKYFSVLQILLEALGYDVKCVVVLKSKCCSRLVH